MATNSVTIFPVKAEVLYSLISVTEHQVDHKLLTCCSFSQEDLELVKLNTALN